MYASFPRIVRPTRFSISRHFVSKGRNNIAPPASKWKKHLEFPLSLALQEESGDGVTQANTVDMLILKVMLQDVLGN